MIREEQETIIRWSAADKTAIIDTADPAMIRKLDKLTAEHPKAYSLTRADSMSKRYEVSARYIRLGKPASEAVKEAARMARAQKSILQ